MKKLQEEFSKEFLKISLKISIRHSEAIPRRNSEGFLGWILEEISGGIAEGTPGEISGRIAGGTTAEISKGTPVGILERYFDETHDETPSARYIHVSFYLSKYFKELLETYLKEILKRSLKEFLRKSLIVNVEESLE